VDAFWTAGAAVMAHNERVTAARPQTSGPGPDRIVLVSNLLAGACWLAVPVALGSVPLALIGAGYVLVASTYLAFFLRAWLVPWLGAAALWVWLLGSVEFENTVTHYVVSLVAGVAVAGLCFAAWQALAAALTFAARSLSLKRA
jgi:hypothetical protein